ncbi:MAG: plastocyanin/azurin family copper-binding protein [Nitrosopumilus sp.]|nr:plastocyanin/azurin family copper-binding protein [Nitrosopumilus sp.]
MVSQGILIGVAVGVFFAGLGIGYTALQSSTPTSAMMNSQQMQQIMNDPQTMNQWHQQMMQNPDAMNQWMRNMMNNPQTVQQMHNVMMSNPQHMNQMMGPMMNHMMNDPQMQQQMMNHMMNNQDMMNMMMGSGMMMDGNMMMRNNMMNNQQFLNNQNDNVDGKTATISNSQNTHVSIARGSASPGCEKTNECYLPYSVTINEHSSVTWTNDDIAVHTVTSGIPSDGHNGIFDSGLISPGATFTNQFDEEGTFDYYCIAHPWMTGKVIVE